MGIESLFFRIRSYFGAEPTSRDPACEARRRPEPASAPPAEPEVAAYLRSPYECAPTTWGLVELQFSPPAPQGALPAPEAARPTPSRRPFRPEAHALNKPGPPVRRRRFRLKLAPNRQPPPRGLLSS